MKKTIKKIRFFEVKENKILSLPKERFDDIFVGISSNKNPVTVWNRFDDCIYGYRNILLEFQYEILQLKNNGYFLPNEEVENIKKFLVHMKNIAQEAKNQYEKQKKEIDITKKENIIHKNNNIEEKKINFDIALKAVSNDIACLK